MGINETESHESTTTTIKSPPPPPPPPQAVAPQNEVQLELVKCDCCGLTEECTLTYISKVKERHQGKWICGLCAEAVKDEISRSSSSSDETISIEEALKLHMNFCKKFRLSAMKHLLRRSLDSPPSRVLVRSNSSSSSSSSSSTKNSDHNAVHLTRSGSCFSTLAR
ncbi:hypothetical protein MKW94_026981 [Papaver nudicaule]|uniref:DUF1677 family protein n=1 Tax=Papaver nudicaule TaxID=74823 RepID=A0AA41S9P6_PAPNU|nr:hypothetical protein [Papaver nudicaule]